MKIPWTGIVASLLATTGGITLLWYSNLTKTEQEEADEAAERCAKGLYNKAMNQLSSNQVEQVRDLVQSRFTA